jgi:hypothetical protein
VSGYCLKFLAACLVSYVGIVLIGYFGDPANVFRATSYYDQVSSAMLEGENVVGLNHVDERLLQKYLLLDQHAYWPVIVLGSSRSMEISAEMLGVDRTFNESVGGAEIEDFLGILEMHYERGALPRTVVMGLDPNFVLGGNTDAWVPLSDYYFRMRSRLLGTGPLTEASQWTGAVARDLQAYQQITTLPYFKASVAQIWGELAGTAPPPYSLTREQYANDWMKRADGTRGYPPEWRDRAVSEVEANARGMPLDQWASRQLDPAETELFERMLAWLRTNQVEVVLVLLPYHPITSSRLSQSAQFAGVEVAEEYFNAVARTYGLVSLGTFFGQRSSCESDEFYEAVHPRPDCVKRILAPYRDAR